MMRRPSRLRKTAFVAVMVVFVGGIVELASFVGLSLASGRLTGLGTLAAERRSLIGRQERVIPVEKEVAEVEPWVLGMRQGQVLHPYLGYVDRPKDDLKAWAPLYFPEGNDYGFPKNFHAFFSGVGPDDVVVVVVGGSVAHQIAAQGRPAPFLERALNGIRRYGGKRVKVLNLAVGGYKQPQQMAVFNYFLAVGMHIDVLINVDGFNEVTLPVKDNLSVGVNPYYPRWWKFRVETIDSEERRVRGEISFLDSLRREVASWFSRTPVQYSFTAGVVWRLIDTKIKKWGVEREIGLLERTSDNRTFEAYGPPYSFGSKESLYEDLVAVWRRCSIQMYQLATAQDIDYFHFLQPNQYDAGSKELTAQERRTAWDPQSRFLESVAFGYPMLRSEAEYLKASGVRFVDLTGIFKDVDQNIYIDPCCHFNLVGVEILAEAIAEEIQNAGDVHDS